MALLLNIRTELRNGGIIIASTEMMGLLWNFPMAKRFGGSVIIFTD
jgi:hypothetical protein